MSLRFGPSPTTLAAAAAVLVLAGAATPAHAQRYQLVMRGALDGRSSLVSGGTATPLAGRSPFTVRAVFDTRSPNLVDGIFPFPVPGFVAYAPTAVTMTIGGRTYAMQSYAQGTSPAGVSVAIFDATTPFGPPNRYGVGLIQDPVLDGAGFVADYGGASPPFTIASDGIVPTKFLQYFGVGVQGGACLVGNPETGCQEYAVTPIPLTRSGQSLGLVLGNYVEEVEEGTVWTAQISAVPEPATVALVGAGVLALAGVGARRRRTA